MIIRELTASDKTAVIDMMRVFYASAAVHTNGSEEIFENDVENCINDSPYLEGYVFEENGELLGYAMVAKSFSTEFGKPCMWIEDIYLKAEYRGQGIGMRFMDYMKEKYPDTLQRLEAEEENETALKLYKKAGFTTLPYVELMR